MNIFVLDYNPIIAAEMQCDKHVCKMVIETAQLLCSPFQDGEAPYKRTHYNHPCAKWVRTNWDNYNWLMVHGITLAEEFDFRYGHPHACTAIYEWLLTHHEKLKEVIPQVVDSIAIGDLRVTEFVQAMPDHYKVNGDAVRAYRNYYLGDKARFAKWKHSRLAPSWFIETGHESSGR